MARQFVDMNRVRVEGLLSAFPKLIPTGKQHTYLETENVRYVYQPLEELYVVLITNKSSNLIEDLDTLRLISRLIPEYCPTINEESISEKAFEFIFSLDEVVSMMGYRENVTLDLIRTILAMDSNEEKLQEMIQKSKEDDANSMRRKIAKQLDQERAKDPHAHAHKGGISSNDSYGSMGAGSYGNSFANITSVPVVNDSQPYATSYQPKVETKAKLPRGMVLGKTNRDTTHDVLRQMAKEGEISEDNISPQTTGKPVSFQAQHQVQVQAQSIHLTIQENLKITLDKEGGIQEFDVKGYMDVAINDSSNNTFKVYMGKSNITDNFQMKMHPTINKQLFQDENILSMKEASRPFTAGKILMWRLHNPDETIVPLTINCWPTVKPNGTITVSVEYDLQRSDMALHNVQIHIPCPLSPNIEEPEQGLCEHTRSGEVVWQLQTIDSSNANSSLEFTVNRGSRSDVDASSFFPVQITFSSNNTISGLDISGVSSTSDGSSLAHSKEVALLVDEFSIV